MYNGQPEESYSRRDVLGYAALGLAALLTGCGDKRRKKFYPTPGQPTPPPNAAPVVLDPTGNNGQVNAGATYELNVLATDDVLPSGSSLEGRLFGGATDSKVSIVKLNETVNGTTRQGSWIFRYTSPANDTAGQKRYTFEARDGDLSGVRDITFTVIAQAPGGGGSSGGPGTSSSPAPGGGGTSGQPGTGNP